MTPIPPKADTISGTVSTRSAALTAMLKIVAGGLDDPRVVRLLGILRSNTALANMSKREIVEKHDRSDREEWYKRGYGLMAAMK
jgi:hypothetical protein